MQLQELHAHELVNAEHTTLFTTPMPSLKVGDIAKVDVFIHSEGRIVGTVAFDCKVAPAESNFACYCHALLYNPQTKPRSC